MDVCEIVKDRLQKDGYDGLAGEDCSCLLSDLMPCDNYAGNCEAGYKILSKECDKCKDFSFCLSSDKVAKCPILQEG